MRAQTWLSTSASLCFLFSIPVLLAAGSAAAAAQPLPQECIDAGVKNKQECDDLLKKAGKGEKPAPAAATDAAAPAANEPAPAPTPPVPAAKVVVLPPDCVAAGLTTLTDCDALHAAGAAKKGKEKLPVDATPAVAAKPPAAALAPVKPTLAAPAVDNSNADQTAKSAIKGVHLAKDCVAAGLTTQADCDALHALDVAKKANAKAKGPVDASQAAPAPAAAAAPVLAPPTPATVTPPVENGSAARSAATALTKDCISAGLTTQADCDALHALDGAKKGNAKARPVDASQAPTAPAVAAAPAAVAPTPATINPTVENGPATTALTKDCIAAGLKTTADCDALHPINVQKGKGKLPADAGQAAPVAPAALAPVAPEPATVTPTVDNGPAATPAETVTPATGAVALAKDCLAAGLKTAADCDALHAINAQKGKGKLPADASQAAPAAPATALAPVAPKPGVTPQAAQPLEVVPNLPKGVTADQVAPLLDSAKVPEKSGKGPVAPAASQVEAAPATPPPPPPTSDKSAQADIKLAKVAPIDEVKGQQVDPKANLQVQVPQNVTIVNQTIVNTTTNNTTNNTTVAPNPGQKGKPTDHPPYAAPPDANHPRNAIGLSFGLVLQLGTQLIISSPARDQYRIADNDRDRTDYEQLPQDRYRETITRPDGVRIVTVYNRNGDILRRSRFDRDGREIVLAYFDDSRDQDLLQWRDPGDDLPPLRLGIPAQDYVLDADQADEAQVARFFVQPPVERVQRLYSISEVKRSARIRDMVRRLEIGDLTFDTGSATLSPDQIPALSSVANAMLQLLQQNPAETFLIEGHTDAVGSDVANLQLSDARAAAVAQILTDAYHIPPENLTTQGYGAQFLKVATAGPERINRRVTIRRITPLVTVAGP